MSKSAKRSPSSRRSAFRPRLTLASSHPRLAEIIEGGFRLCTPPPNLTVSEWADEHRRLSSVDSAEPGRWRTSRAEYQRGIMDAMADPTVEEIVCMKGTQIGWTALLGNVIGFHIDQDPAPILMILPTVNLAKAWSKDRLAPMLRDTPKLRGKVKDPRSRDSGNTILHKEFPGGHLTAIGANAPAELASRPIRIVLNDEVDRYPVSAGTEGDPQKLAAKRQETFWNRKTLKGSTPTVKGESVIERDYETSDQRLFFVPCHSCGKRQPLRWEQVKWEKSDDGDHQPETARYQCEHCGTLWSDAERWAAVAKGKWKATKPFNGVAGFHLSQLYSPWVKLVKAVREFLAARRDPELLKVWTNTVLAQTFEERGETVEATGLRARVENYGTDSLPAGVWYATAGVDVQGDRLEVEVVGWGEREESWGVDYQVLYGDPSQGDVWEDLDEILLRKYEIEPDADTGEIRVVRVLAACVDMGGHHGAEVLAFCERRFKRGVWPIKGQAGPRIVWPTRAGRTKDRRKVWIVGVDTAKDSIYGRLKIEEHGPGYCHIPAHYPDDWFDQVTAEKVVTRWRLGRPYRVWMCPPGVRNEGLDCRVYAYAARMSLTPRQARKKRGAAKERQLELEDPATGMAAVDEDSGEPKTDDPLATARKLRRVRPAKQGFSITG